MIPDVLKERKKKNDSMEKDRKSMVRGVIMVTYEMGRVRMKD